MIFGPGLFTLQWSAPPNQHYVLEWSDTLLPGSWQPYPDVITSATTTYTFTDDGSKTGPLNAFRFYRIYLVP